MLGLTGLKLYAAIGAMILVIAAVGTVIGWKLKAERLGKAQEVIGEGVKSEEQERGELIGQLSESDKIQRARDEERQAARGREDDLMAAIRRRDAQLSALLAKEKSERDRIGALRPEEFEPEIKARLGLRRPDDVGRPGFTTEELHAIDDAVTLSPIYRERIVELEGKVAEQGGQIVAIKAQMMAIEAILVEERKKNEARLAYEVKLLGHYRDAVNAIGLKKRSIKCLGLWKCGERRLPVPRPEELAAEAPK